MYALPTLRVQDGKVTIREGFLTSLPLELQSNAQIQFYRWQCKDGWNVCPQGYHVFAKTDFTGNRFIIPGLIITGRKNSSKRFYNKRLELTEGQVSSFMDSLIEEAKIIEDKKNAELSMLIHDLRGFSSAIYNSAEEAKTFIGTDDRTTAASRIESIIATQVLLSIRIDLLDFAANQVALDTVEKIPVYRKVHKVVRCFRAKARAKQVNIYIEGHSVKRTIGPAIFELIIYSIIENAIKYSPSNNTIRVRVLDLNREISVNIMSVGPKISRAERVKIFDKGFRALHAEMTSQAGTGLGLHASRSLLENYFGGSITVQQTGIPKKVNGIDYLDTDFEILIPEHNNDYE